LYLILIISGLSASSNYRGEMRLTPKGAGTLNHDSSSTHPTAVADGLLRTLIIGTRDIEVNCEGSVQPQYCIPDSSSMWTEWREVVTKQKEVCESFATDKECWLIVRNKKTEIDCSIKVQKCLQEVAAAATMIDCSIAAFSFFFIGILLNCAQIALEVFRHGFGMHSKVVSSTCLFCYVLAFILAAAGPSKLISIMSASLHTETANRVQSWAWGASLILYMVACLLSLAVLVFDVKGIDNTYLPEFLQTDNINFPYTCHCT
jgi:hypothetical protein